ncbi:DUF4159 domain-containing protein [Nostocaceae cyanobacterium CENA369]|uniref:DUF4159 domain-containing protein n=1 Tax=Dendronalium phyllosphericum CENA369 TaxID=1725256 RepID=A0A8J7I6I5_9NOST|nr:DUF4159 domain-containing protein [Dendronalium phyllosphericum]MBH8572462.1 DUF4159 domain-containing protein [Dendronalium phyllosphericum CENA369]
MYHPPQIQPLERLQIEDGLMINAERWKRSHDYHRQRQNIHYQSLNQPGIVRGLGVSLILAPPDVPSQYNDGRWLQIQPGIAIDLVGNPIVVSQAIDFHLAADITEEKPRLIYIVVSYVDPENLQRKQVQEFEPESFRIYEKTIPPDAMEVELCRILLQPGLVSLQNPQDVFFPGLNSLDFRYRTIARSRPTNIVRVAHLETTQLENPNSFANLSYLIKSTANLTYTLQGTERIDRLVYPLQDVTTAIDYDLLFLTGRQPLTLGLQELTDLKSYLDTGGVLLVESPTDAVNRLESIMDLTDKLGTPLEDLRRLDRNHPMRTQPFLFAALPIFNQKPIQILIAGGIVLVIGDLSACWGLDEKLSLPRETIRSAQELGINILHFAWARRQMTQLQRQTISLTPPTTSTKPDALKSLFNKLEQ